MTATDPPPTPRPRPARAAPAPRVRLQGVGHTWDAVQALRPLDLDIAAGSFVAVVGPSGCGKSTLLRLLAGLERPTDGAIAIGPVDPDQARRRGQVGWMAQRPALLPWATALDNVTLARRLTGGSASLGSDEPSPAELLDLVGLHDAHGHLPGALSGGMGQRVALARTLAQGACLWLMDEPLAALDELTREAVADDLLMIWTRRRPTVVWVTHHLGEAVALADRVVVLSPRPGRVVADIAVPLPRPRDPTAARTQSLVRRVRTALDTPAGGPAGPRDDRDAHGRGPGGRDQPRLADQDVRRPVGMPGGGPR